MNFDIIAVMGRGIQPKTEGQPARNFDDWEPTGIFEMVGTYGEHLPIRESIDENSPRCMIGGGNLNVEAATYLWMESTANIVVFAYGNTRTPALATAGAPFEGEVMAQEFRRLILGEYGEEALAGTEFLAWTKDERELCSSALELRQVFDLAIKRGLRRIAIVTVAVHQPRVQIFVDKLRLSSETYLMLNVKTFCSETLILQNHSGAAEEIIREFTSPAFARTAKREEAGVKKLLHPDTHGEYNPQKPLI